MANWKTTVKIGDIHIGHENGLLNIRECGKMLAERLEKNRYHAALEEQIDMLKNVEDVEDYDYAIGELYDFGDTDHRIWFDPTGDDEEE